MNNPEYFKELKPHNCRRAKFHDYKRPGRYMISISKAPECPDFSRLLGWPDRTEDPARVQLSEFGVRIQTQIAEVNALPQFDIDNSVIMPDHLHLLWRVKDWLPRDLGYYVGIFKTSCVNHIRKEIPGCAALQVFTPKFNDRIAFDDEMARRFYHYIEDNPRRRLMVMRYPELFSKACQVRILDRIFDVYGNFQLLKHPLISAAVVSSRYTPEERTRYRQQWDETIRGCGVFISPFISEAEKRLRDEILESGGSIIRIIPEGIQPKYKPSGQEFDLCAQGRCLHIGAPRPSAHAEALSRRECLELNEISRWIASHPAETFHLLNGKRQGGR